MAGLELGIEDRQDAPVSALAGAIKGMQDKARERLDGLELTGAFGLGEFGLTGEPGQLGELASGIRAFGSAGEEEMDRLSAETDALKESMERTGLNASMFFEDLHEGAAKALESAFAMQELNRSMVSAQGRIMDMSLVISGLLDQMSALSQAVSGMELSPSVLVQIGNKRLDGYITSTSTKGMAQAQQNILASQGWG
jgi:hypothetical protein